jgi:hypothetical protein
MSRLTALLQITIRRNGMLDDPAHWLMWIIFDRPELLRRSPACAVE